MHLGEIVKIINGIKGDLRDVQIEYSLVTNGTLLDNDKIIKELYDYNIKTIQITLDGDKKDHDRYRKNCYGGSFDKILNNIKVT